VIVALSLLVAAAIAGGAAVCVVALNAQRDALERVTELAEAQAKRDADERHTLADRLQHPEIVRPFRTAPEPREQPTQTAGLGLAGTDVSDLTDAEIIEEFGKDILDAI
jgi:hypothetical protein